MWPAILTGRPALDFELNSNLFRTQFELNPNSTRTHFEHVGDASYCIRAFSLFFFFSFENAGFYFKNGFILIVSSGGFFVGLSVWFFCYNFFNFVRVRARAAALCGWVGGGGG